MKGTLNLILALPAEASPIIRYFNLQLIIFEPYKIYTNHDNSLQLVVSGVGKLHTNKAVSNIEKASGKVVKQNIELLIKDADLAKILGDKARKTVLDRATVPKMVDGFINAIE